MQSSGEHGMQSINQFFQMVAVSELNKVIAIYHFECLKDTTERNSDENE
jgi:hypothetical protein